MIAEEGRGTGLLVELLERLRADADVGDLVSPDLDPVDVASRLLSVARSAPAMTWVGVNGPRVDVVLSDDRDEWRVVFGSEDGRTVTWLFVYQRPPFFAGIPGGRAVIVNGPSGSGKSTVLEVLQRTATGMPLVVFDEPEHVGSVGSEYLIWRDQAPLLHQGYLAAIGALTSAGNLVAVAAAGRTQEEFQRHFLHTPIVSVGLYCDHDVLMVRERGRSDRWGGLAEASISVHDGWHYDLTFDTTDSPDPAEMAAIILQAMQVRLT